MIVRVYGADRVISLEIDPSSTVEALKQKIGERVGTEEVQLTINKSPVNDGTLSANGIKHGTVVHASYEVKKEQPSQPDQPDQPNQPKQSKCMHGPSGMCQMCAPEDAWVSSAFENRRFISQGAYEEYLASKQLSLQLETHLPPACRTHPKDGRCNRCLPKEIEMTRQIFRPVDHIEIHGRDIIKEVLRENAGKQGQVVRLLVGRYQEYKDVPKGIKAEVFATIPIEHTSIANGVVIDSDGKALNGADEPLNEVLKQLDLEVVGMVYTRIVSEKMPYISALEVCFIAEMQSRYIYRREEAEISSRFVTLIVSGTPTHSEVVEVCCTNLAMELKRDGMLFSSENPLEAVVDPVTAVWRGKEGVVTGHTIPVEYLIVRPTHGVIEGKGIFAEAAAGQVPFKRGSGESGIKKHLQKRMTSSSVMGVSFEAVKDLQLLVEMASMKMPIESLTECIKERDSREFMNRLMNGEYDFLTSMGKECREIQVWACQVCTLENRADSSVCDACGIPKE